MKTIVFINNSVQYFKSHRQPIAKALCDHGHRVVLISPGVWEKDPHCPIEHYEWCISRRGANPFSELCSLIDLYRILRKIRPDIVHAITLKPYIYGGLAARLAGVPNYVCAVAGLGLLFSSNCLKYRVLRALLFPLFKIAFSHPHKTVIFQNPDDKSILMNWLKLDEGQAALIHGSGVDLDKFCAIAEPQTEKIIFTFASRLLKDKGILELMQAAQALEQQENIVIKVAGTIDEGNPESLTKKDIEEFKKRPNVEFLGHVDEVNKLFQQSHVIVLPSFYGEGLPRVLIEASAVGRPIITTDHPGCRDAVIDKKTGLLIPIKDATALEGAMLLLANNPELRKTMGEAARELCKEKFSIDLVVRSHLDIYEKLLASPLS